MPETNIKYPISIFQILTTWSVWIPKSAYSVKVVKKPTSKLKSKQKSLGGIERFSIQSVFFKF